MWDEIGELQFAFLQRHDLAHRHCLLNIGCGCMRGGIHFAHYLEVGHYFDVDANQLLLEAGMRELETAYGRLGSPVQPENSRFSSQIVEGDWMMMSGSTMKSTTPVRA